MEELLKKYSKEVLSYINWIKIREKIGENDLRKFLKCHLLKNHFFCIDALEKGTLLHFIVPYIFYTLSQNMSQDGTPSDNPRSFDDLIKDIINKGKNYVHYRTCPISEYYSLLIQFIRSVGEGKDAYEFYRKVNKKIKKLKEKERKSFWKGFINLMIGWFLSKGDSR